MQAIQHFFNLIHLQVWNGDFSNGVYSIHNLTATVKYITFIVQCSTCKSCEAWSLDEKRRTEINETVSHKNAKIDDIRDLIALYPGSKFHYSIWVFIFLAKARYLPCSDVQTLPSRVANLRPPPPPVLFDLMSRPCTD